MKRTSWNVKRRGKIYDYWMVDHNTEIHLFTDGRAKVIFKKSGLILEGKILRETKNKIIILVENKAFALRVSIWKPLNWGKYGRGNELSNKSKN